MHNELNRGISKIVRDYKHSSGMNFNEMALRSGIAQSHFSRMIDLRSKNSKAMSKDHAKRVLLACNYPMDEALYTIAKIKAEAALEFLEDFQQRKLINYFNEKY